MISSVEPERRLTFQKIPPSHEKRTQEIVNPRWIWLNLDAHGVIEVFSRRRIFDDRDTALAYCENNLLKRQKAGNRLKGRDVIFNSPLFEDLNKSQIKELLSYAHPKQFREGDVIFNQGDVGREAYFLVKGQMDVLLDIPGSSRKKRVSALNEGTLFGEMGILDGAPRSATIKAMQKSYCFSLCETDFQDLQLSEPEIFTILMRNVSRQFADRLRIANMMISELEK